MHRVGVAAGVLIVSAALGVSACGGGGSSSAQGARTASARAGTPSTSTTGVSGAQHSNGATSNAAGTGGRTGTGTSTPHGTPTSTPHSTTTSTPHAPTTSAPTTTTIAIPKPTIDQGATSANPDPPFEHNPQNGEEVAICSGTPPTTLIAARWLAYNADFVQIDRGSTNYPPQGSNSAIRLPCPEPADNALYVTFNAFGKGGEAEISYIVDIDPNYRP